MIHRVGKHVTCLLSVLGTACSVSLAQGPPGRPPTTPWTSSFAIAPVHQLEAALDGGGDVSVSSLLARFDVSRQVHPSVELKLGFRYDFDDYDFSGLSILGGQDPWDAIHRAGISCSVGTQFAERYTAVVAPSVDYSGASGATFEDAISFGGVLFVMRLFNPGLMIGLGGGVYRDLEETTGFPFLAIRWQMTDRFRLANPFRPGPTGPAGLEVACQLGEKWEVAVGGVWRAARFRLDQNAPVPSGIGEAEGLPVFLRVSRVAGEAFSVDAYAGAVLEGKLRLEDSGGRRIRSEGYDTAPMIAVAVSKQF